MLTGVFKERSKDRRAKQRATTEEQALAELLAARELRNFQLTRHCEIGPFVVDGLFADRSVIVELVRSGASRHQTARLKFFNDMGYVVLTVDGRELRRRPRRVLGRLLTALRSG